MIIQIDSQPSSFTATGRYFRIMDAAARVTVRFFFPDGREHETNIRSGIGLRFPNDRYPKPFTKFEISSENAQKVEIFAGDVEYEDNRTEGLRVSVTGAAEFRNDAKQVTDAAAVSLVPNTPERRKATFQAIGGTIYLGGPGVTVANGFEIGPGSSIEVEVSDAFYAIAKTGETVDVRILEELN